MNRKITGIFLTGALVSFALVGCGGGTTEEKEAAAEIFEQLQERRQETETDSQEETAVAPAEAAAEETDEQETKSAFRLYDVSEEIKNSKFTDDVVQVGGTVFHDDGSMTVGEFAEELRRHGEVTIIGEHGKEIRERTKVEPADDVTMHEEYSLVDEFGEEICKIAYINDTDETISAYDCRVTGINAPDENSPNSLNFFYAGDLCAATYGYGNDLVETYGYAERMEEYPKLTAENISEILRFRGIDRAFLKEFDTGATTGVKYWFFVSSEDPMCVKDGEEYYRLRAYEFNLSAESGEVYYIIINDTYTTSPDYAGSYRGQDYPVYRGGDSEGGASFDSGDYTGFVTFVENLGDGTYSCKIGDQPVTLSVADDAEIWMTSFSEKAEIIGDNSLIKIPGKDFKQLSFGYGVSYEGSELYDFDNGFYGEAEVVGGEIVSFMETFRE